MAKKNGKQAVTPSSTRPKSSSSLSQGNGSSSAGSRSSSTASGRILTSFARSGSFFAQASLAADAHTVRIFDVASGSCSARWASSSTSSERIESIEWAELEASQNSSEENQGKAPRGKKRRKSSLSGSNAPETSQAATQGSLTNGVSHAQSQQVLCIGLSSGAIHVLHPTQSSILATLSHATSSSSIQSLSFPQPQSLSEHNLLWSCSANGQILAWSLPNIAGSNACLLARYEGAGSSWSQMSVRYVDAEPSSSASSINGSGSSRKAQILVAQHAIKLFQADLPQPSQRSESAVQTPSIQLKASFTGHTSEVSQMLWHPSLPPTSSAQSNGHTTTPASRFTSIALGDRSLNVWSVADDAAEGADGLLAATIALDDNIESISLSEDGSLACAVLASGSAAILPVPSSIFSPSASSSSSDRKKRRKSIVASLQVATSITAPADGTGATDSKVGADSSSVRLSRNPVKPAFDVIQLRNSDEDYIAAINIGKRGLSNGVLIGADSAFAQTPKQRAQYSETSQSAVLSGDAAQPDAPVVPSESRAEGGALEPTLAQRLRGLQVEQGGDAGGEEALLGSRTRSRRSGGNGKIADATSLSQSLVQALHSSDARLLESCLQRSDPKIIRNTVRRLPNTLVLTLVEALVERLGRSKQGFGSGTGGVDASRGSALVEWLRHVLIVHLAYLITIPALVTRLASLHSTLDSRVTYHNQLLALNGRLDLVVSQIDLRAEAPASQRSLVSSTSKASQLRTESSGPNKYVEGETSSESDSEEEAEVQAPIAAVQPAEEGAEIEDLVMGQDGPRLNGEAGSDEDVEDEDEDEDEEDDMPALRKGGLTKVNGFLELEASESEGEGSDEDDEEGGSGAAPRRKAFSLVNGDLGEDPEEDEGDELDRYESDFINDDSEEDGESEVDE